MKTRSAVVKTTNPNTMAGRFRTACATKLLPLLLLMLLPTAVQAQYNYTTNNGVITITGYDCSVGPVAIPSTINGLPVANIGNYAFDNCASLTSVTIPNSVTAIGDGAFANCPSLTNVTIPNSVTSIGTDTFSGCPSLTSVTIPNGVTNIGHAMFYGCSSLTSVTIPDSVTAIGDYAFDFCTSLTSVTIPDSVTSIGSFAFSGCSSLSAITVDAFNSFYSSVAGVLLNKSQTTLIQYPGGKAGSYTVPNSVTSIENWAFSYCGNLTSVTIGNGVTSIGSDAFNSCTSLTSVTIPNSVTSIGNYAFSGCSSLTSVTIPNSVTSIGYDTFAGCSSLTNVTIPNSVTTIGHDAFNSCISLTSIAIPDSVTSIENDAFWSCPSLTSVTIGNRVTYIGPGAFIFCISLTSVVIPNSVTSIGNDAFNDCTSLTGVYFLGNAPSLGASVFSTDSGYDSATVYYLPGATGFGATFGGLPTALWTGQPLVIVTKVFAQVGGMPVVLPGTPTEFVAPWFGLDWNPSSCTWNFGDGSSSTDCNPMHVYTNCQPFTVTYTGIEGETTNSTNTVIAVPCEMNVTNRGTKAQAKLNFSKTNADSFTLTALVDLGEGFSAANKSVTLSFGGTELSFTLDPKGRGVSRPNSCGLKYNKKNKLWTFTAKCKSGAWQDKWSAYSLKNETVAKPGRSVTVPVVLLLGDEVFAADKSLIYTAKANKSGSAK